MPLAHSWALLRISPWIDPPIVAVSQSVGKWPVRGGQPSGDVRTAPATTAGLRYAPAPVNFTGHTSKCAINPIGGARCSADIKIVRSLVRKGKMPSFSTGCYLKLVFAFRFAYTFLI